MTISESNSALFHFFIDNESFSFEQNFSDIVPVSIDQPLDRAIVLESLRQFEEQKLITRLDVEGKALWVLQLPLAMHPQKIEIGGRTAAAIESLVNTFLIKSGHAGQRVNALDLDERAIQILVHIGELLFSEDSKAEGAR